ncbi:ABC transporter [Sphingobium lactosutens]|uniref:GldG family protein n=1 Tax=Sphingobium lactosutens TaxID=522773 RepID=UPI0021198A3D|nr:GldG family protein [Sphingobium lactosutens]NWK94224.1 ABC transporter [Sphingobium lactosutens]
MDAMMAALKRFLWLWLPMLAVLLAGLARAWRTGQADPWDWGSAAFMVAVVVGLLLARRGWAVFVWVALGAAGPALIFCALVAGRMPDMAAAGLLALALSGIFGSAWLRSPPMAVGVRGRVAGIFLLAIAALLFWFGPAHPVAPVPDRPKLAILTALPLFWAGPGQAGTGPRDAPIVTLLRTRFTVEPLDDPRRLARSGVRRLLIAQPRAMAPEQFVALDDWIRAGGTALVLADPLLRWPSDLPLGDRRRAPSASLLAPLLDHWGFVPGTLAHGEIRHVLPNGRLVTLSGAAMGSAVPERRRIGRGEAILLGDADLIDDRLWLADPARPLDPRAWVADTPALIAQWLGAPISGERRWMRAPADVILGLRWAILAGTGWAMLGAVLLIRQFTAKRAGTKSENQDERSQ